MLSKRAIAISADKAFAKRLAVGLQGAGAATETSAALEDLAKGEIKADLVAVHVTEGAEGLVEGVAARLQKDAHIIGVIPSSSLEKTVNIMKSPRVAAVLVADELEPATLSAVASRLLYGDVFGLEKVVPWGVRVYSTLVGDYQEKSVAIAAVSDFAASMGVRRKYRESIEQCLDEMLMNALYDAPVDSAGKQMFAEIPTKTRISLRMEQKAVVQYGCDGNVFALSVRDSFGALKSDTIVKYLDKCLHSEQQVDRKAGGAGLGLYIISNAATLFVVNIYPGVATEAICTFDLNAAKVQLKKFGVFQERIDSAGRLAVGPSRLMAMGPGGAVEGGNGGAAPVARASRGVTVALGAAILLLLALIGIVAYPRFSGPARGAIAVTTTPPGAQIDVNGNVVGMTADGALQVPDLEVDKQYVVTARRDGYENAVEIVTPRKETTAIALTLKAKASTLVLRTTPAGAAVLAGGVDLGATPITLTSFPAESVQELTMRKVGYADLVEKVTMPRAGGEKELQFSLPMSPDFGSVRIESTPPGATILQNGELLAGLATPVAEHIIQANRSYTFTIKLPGRRPETRTVTVRPGARGEPITVELAPGGGLTVETNLTDARVTVAGVPECTNQHLPLADCGLPNGVYKVRLTSKQPWASEGFEVTIADADVKRTLDFGFVETPDADHVLQFRGAPAGTRRAAFLEGTREVTVVNTSTNEQATKSVRVLPGRTVTVGLTE